MKPIQSESDRMVAFSKRRNGLFKKASELATLCGVEIAIIIFSLSGKPFSFGSPSVESVLDRFSKENNMDEQSDDHRRIARTRREARIKDLDQELDEINQKVAAEKKRGQMLQQTTDSFDSYVDGLDVNGLKDLVSKLERLQQQVNHARLAHVHQASSSSEPCKDKELDDKENVEGKATTGVPKNWLKL